MGHTEAPYLNTRIQYHKTSKRLSISNFNNGQKYPPQKRIWKMIQREIKIFEEHCCGLGLCVKQTLYCTRPGLIDFFSIDERAIFSKFPTVTGEIPPVSFSLWFSGRSLVVIFTFDSISWPKIRFWIFKSAKMTHMLGANFGDKYNWVYFSPVEWYGRVIVLFQISKIESIIFTTLCLYMIFELTIYSEVHCV